MKRLSLIAVAVVGLSVFPPALAIADPNDCYDDVDNTCGRGGVSHWLSPDNVQSATYQQMDIDAQAFLDYLESHGIRSQDTAELRSASVGMGLAICNTYATTLSNTKASWMVYNLGYTNPRDAATWTVASVDYLCPQYGYLLGGPS